jgi:two-component system nitrate/nitrite response regulator NarL
MIPTSIIRILLVDDHHLFSDGLRSMISSYDHISVVEQVYHSPEVFAKVQLHNPDIIVMDFNMPKLNGMDIAKSLLRQNRKTKILMLSMYKEVRHIEEFKRFGVKGYLLKTAKITEVVQAIEEIHKGVSWFELRTSADTSSNHADDYFLKTFRLTSREVDVLRLIRDGLDSQEISEKLSISFTTVGTHRKNICTKLNLSGKNELLRFAIENDI